MRPGYAGRRRGLEARAYGVSGNDGDELYDGQVFGELLTV